MADLAAQRPRHGSLPGLWPRQVRPEQRRSDAPPPLLASSPREPWDGGQLGAAGAAVVVGPRGDPGDRPGGFSPPGRGADGRRFAHIASWPGLLPGGWRPRGCGHGRGRRTWSRWTAAPCVAAGSVPLVSGGLFTCIPFDLGSWARSSNSVIVVLLVNRLFAARQSENPVHRGSIGRGQPSSLVSIPPPLLDDGSVVGG